MSQASFYTTIIIKGDSKDISKVLTIMREKYSSGVSEYFDSINVKLSNENSHSTNIEDLSGCSDDTINNFAIMADGKEIIIEADGPYGRYGALADTSVFNTIAKAVPNVNLEGSAGGFDVGGNYDLSVSLDKGLLHYTSCNIPYETFDDDYLPYVESILSISKFCELFKISSDEDVVIDDFYSFFNDVFPLLDEYSYKDFKRDFKSNIKDKSEFKAAIEQLKSMKIKDYETFCDEGEEYSFDYDLNSGKYIYFESDLNSNNL